MRKPALILLAALQFSSCVKKDYSELNGIDFRIHPVSPRGHDLSFPFEENTIRIVSHEDHKFTDDEKRAFANGTKIVAALKAFREENGGYPDSLENLVPKYLQKVPKTGFDGFWESREFEYERMGGEFLLYFNGGFEDVQWLEGRNCWDFRYD